MAEAATIARPYAKAAFASARDAGALPPWSKALYSGAELMKDTRVAAVLGDPKIGVDRVVSMFAGLGGNADGTAAEGIDGHWQNFVRLLVLNKRLDVLPEIAAQYEILRAEYENEVEVQVTSAIALSDSQRSKLVAALTRRFNREVRMTTTIEPALLGGAVIRAGDLVIDGSIHGRLQRMASELGN